MDPEMTWRFLGGANMVEKRKKLKGRVKRIIHHPGGQDKAEVVIPEAEPLYQEIRISSETDGGRARLESGDEVNITIEAEDKPHSDDDPSR